MNFRFVKVVIGLKIIKNWFTEDKEDRIFHLIKDSYGSYSDWKFIYYAKYPKAWKVELKLHNKLKEFNFPLLYNHY